MSVIDLSVISSRSVLGRLIRWPLRMSPRGRSVPVLQGPMRGMRWTIGAGTHAFEPLPANAAVLRRHVALNRLDGVVEVIEAAGWPGTCSH
jgi:hypothetical protein